MSLWIFVFNAITFLNAAVQVRIILYFDLFSKAPEVLQNLILLIVLYEWETCVLV
jgi:hypothetical protein